MEFNHAVVWERLKVIGTEWFAFELAEATRNQPFSRYYISSLYGGGTRAAFPVVKKEKADIHGINNFCFVNLELNPHAPQHPGAPGLYFRTYTAAEAITEDKRLFVRLDSDKWLYCGTYRFFPSAPLTAVEFQNQTAKVRR